MGGERHADHPAQAAILTRMDNRHLDELIAASRSIVVTPQQREEQRRSFVYGNIAIENARVTREIVNEAAARLGPGER